MTNYNKWLHRYIVLVVLVTSVLIYAGGLVTTLGAGLAVPDWPLSFGSFNPEGWWKKPMVREEHGHRLIGALTGLLTLTMGIWLHFKGQRLWLKRLGVIAIAVVILQGIIGGLRVIDKNIYFAMLHACLAQAFFCILISLAWGTSASWLLKAKTIAPYKKGDVGLAASVCILIFIQLIIGAVMRHSGAGMAITTFPLVHGHWLPAEWTFNIGVHYVHRVWAVIVSIGVMTLFFRSLKFREFWPRLCASLAFSAVFIQIFLGGMIIVSKRAIIPTTTHVLTGAILLASGLSCLLWLIRVPDEKTSVTQ